MQRRGRGEGNQRLVVIPCLIRNPEVLGNDWIPAFAGMTCGRVLSLLCRAEDAKPKLEESGNHLFELDNGL